MSRLKFLLFSNNNVPCEKALVTSAAGRAFLYRFESSRGEVFWGVAPYYQFQTPCKPLTGLRCARHERESYVRGWRVPHRFFGIRYWAYLKAGIREFKVRRERDL